MKTFAINGKAVQVTHVYKTHPFARGSARFSWIYRLCTIVQNSDNGETIKVKFVGLKSKPTKIVLVSDLINIDHVNTKTIPLST